MSSPFGSVKSTDSLTSVAPDSPIQDLRWLDQLEDAVNLESNARVEKEFWRSKLEKTVAAWSLGHVDLVKTNCEHSVNNRQLTDLFLELSFVLIYFRVVMDDTRPVISLLDNYAADLSWNPDFTDIDRAGVEFLSQLSLCPEIEILEEFRACFGMPRFR